MSVRREVLFSVRRPRTERRGFVRVRAGRAFLPHELVMNNYVPDVASAARAFGEAIGDASAAIGGVAAGPRAPRPLDVAQPATEPDRAPPSRAPSRDHATSPRRAMCKVLCISCVRGPACQGQLATCSLQTQCSAALLHIGQSKDCFLPSFVARIAYCNVYGTTKHLHHAALPTQVELHARVDAACCANNYSERLRARIGATAEPQDAPHDAARRTGPSNILRRHAVLRIGGRGRPARPAGRRQEQGHRVLY